MPARVLMVQGTASSVGKSILVTALCRILRQDGYKVAPFKSQNMALNSFVTREGGEIGRAQAVQAEASGIEPSVYMNPILIKPEAESRCQVIVEGKVNRDITARDYSKHTPYLLGIIKNSLDYLRSSYDIIVIEGAGSPAEINLREREIVNMRIAKMAKAPVLLVGDIDRGGVFAFLFGTLQLLTEEERSRVKGLIINKFRGDISLLKPGLDMLEQKTNIPVLGVIPYCRDIRIAQEDSVYLDEKKSNSISGSLDIVVIQLPHIANYDDFDPLESDGCQVRFIGDLADIGDPDLIIIPGTKSTVHDLAYLRFKGIDRVIIQKSRDGIPVIGICGGFQMLGKAIYDPEHVESKESLVEGLGLLDMETVFNEAKTTTQVKAMAMANQGLFEGLKGMKISGYEIHMGQEKKSNLSPAFQVMQTPCGETTYFDGSVSENCLIFGTYLHGLFHNPDFTEAILNWLQKRRTSGIQVKLRERNSPYDELAKVVRENLNMPEVYRILSGRLNG